VIIVLERAEHLEVLPGTAETVTTLASAAPLA
jgi:hypothetical protein